MKAPNVDQIMKTPVYTVDADDTVIDAIRQMDKCGTKKILVMEEGKPQGVLQKWMITESDHARPVKEMELRPFGRVSSQSPLRLARSKVEEFTAVYVYDSENPDELVGVVTAYDLVRAL